MHSLLATYDVSKAFQLRQGRLDVGSAAVVAYCNYPYPVRLSDNVNFWRQ
jgi:hypothetical protein